MKKNRIISLLIVAVMLVAVVLGIGLSSYAAEEAPQVENKGPIDVWLIGGQSNAVGYGDDAPAEAYDDARYFTGFDNTLFYGVHEQFPYNKDELQFVSLGHGQHPGRSGAEIGIAKMVDGTGKPNAVIKCAVGATSLYPYFEDGISNQVGTWTPPSYEARANMATTDANYAALGTYVALDGTTKDIPDIDLNNKITNGNAANNGNVKSGNMYRMFKKTVTDGVAKLRAEGYTPVIRGMWWMQGEAECYADYKAALYDELLTCLINDIRKDVAAIVGDASVNDATNPMPFLAGNIIWLASNSANAPKYIPTVNAAQATVANAMKNVSYLDKDITNAQSFFGQQDNWHYNVATQQFFGEQLVKYVLERNGQKLVAANGFGFTLTGGGTIANGTNTTVTFKANDNYKINGVTLNGNAVTLDAGGSYNFTVSADTVFDVSTSYTGTLPTTEYGTITDKYVSAEDYPFALFKNGVFQQGYAAWITLMNSIINGSSSDNYVVLLRRNYTTKDYLDDSGALAIGNIDSKLTLDLGGYQITRSQNAYLFDVFHNNKNTYTTDVTIKNGTLVSVTNDPLIGLNYATSSAGASTRTFNFTFDGVTVKNTAESRTIPVIAACWENGSSNVSAGIHANITLNGCTVDFGNIENGIIVGLTNDAKVTNTVGTLTVNGGNIISKGGSYSLAKTDNLDAVTVGEYGGSYPTVTLPTGVAPSTDIYKDANGENCGTVAGKGVVSGSNTVYTMAPDALVTPYGTITDSNFANTSTYPFAIFNKDGFKTCATGWKAAITAAKANLDSDKKVTVYLRKDYEVNAVNNDTFNSLFESTNGTIEIDLGWHTLSRNGKNLFDIWIGNVSYADYTSYVNIKNGTILSADGGSLMGINRTDATTVATKKMYMNYTNVTFKTSKAFDGGLVFNVWSDFRGNNKFNVDMEFNYYGCTFDAKNVMNERHIFRAQDTGNQIDVRVNVYGGEFLNMDTPWMFQGSDGDRMYVGKYEGKYPTLKTTAGVEVKDINSNFFSTTNDSDRTRIVKVSSDSTYNYYTFALQESTPYGYISAAYGDASAYPIAFFSYDGTSYTFLKAGTFGTIREFYSKTEDKNIVAYLRANHTIDLNVDLAQFRGSLTVDLNGKTLTSGDGHMFDVYNIGSNGVAGFASNAVFKNGTLASTGGFAFGINSWGITGQNKIMNVTYDGVTFKYASGNKTGDGTFFNAWTADGGDEFGTVLTFNFNNCVFDYTNAPANAFMFNFTGIDSTEDTDVTAYFNGGKIIASSVDGWKLFNANLSQDSVHFGEAPLTAEIATSGKQPTAANTITTSDETYSYIGIEANNNYKIYSIEVLDTSAEETPYGNITGLTAETVSKADYPVAVFTPNGEVWKYVNVYKTFQEALVEAAKVENSVVFFRTNVNATSSGWFFTGKVIVDLNGYSYSKNGGVYLLDSYIGNVTINCNITFKNGYIKKLSTADDLGLFCLNYHSEQTTLSTFNMTFDNVKLINERNGGTFLFSMWEDGYSTTATKGIKVNATFNGCEFNAYNSIIFTLDKAAGNTQNKTVISVVVNGGKFVGSSAITKDKFIRKNDNDSLTFGKYNGSYPEFVYPKTMGYAVHGISFAANSTNYTLTVNRTDADNVIYAFAPAISTTYGNIPAEYDVSVYPFALFKTDKTFVGGYGNWNSAVNAAVLANSAGSFNLLMRRDATNNNGAGVGGFSGTINADLGGFRLKNEGGYMLDAWIGSNDTERTWGTYNIKNGYIDKYSGDALFCINYGSGLTANITHNLNFEGITFTLYNKARGLFVTWENGYQNGATANQIANCTFTDCTFDLANSADGAVPFILTSGHDAKPNATGTIFNVTINGGTIIADKAIAFSDLVTKNDNEYVVFGKNTAGKYTTLTLPAGAAAPNMSNVWTTADGIECVFVKLADTTYTLYPKVMVGYKLQTSVTLYSNFVYNVYIPKANVKSFTINGNTAEYTTVTIEGVEYYCVSVELPAPETLNDIKVKVTLNSGSTTVDANWTLNVLKYAKSVLADAKTDNVTVAAQALVKDMLVYAKAAHTYFGETASVAEKLTEITTILGTYSATLPTGTAKKPTNKTYFTDVAVYVGEVPSFRFYLASGYTAADFTFTVGGNAVQVKEENGYVEIAMYAYRMLDDVTFTVKGTNVSESYNLYSYYEFAKTQNNANLVSIVEGLMKYSASAKAYRAAYIAANPNA